MGNLGNTQATNAEVDHWQEMPGEDLDEEVMVKSRALDFAIYRAVDGGPC